MQPGVLVDVAAVLTSSAAVGPVAEAFSARENIAFSIVGAAPQPTGDDILGAFPAGDTSVAVAPLPAVDPASIETLTRLSGSPLLQQLSLLSAASLSGFVDAHPETIRSLLTAQPAAQQVTSWWGSLNSAQRVTMLNSAPELVGNLNGIPYATRNGANLRFLDDTVSQLRSVISSDAGRSVVLDARQKLTVAEEVRAALVPDELGAPRALLSLDVSGQGKAAVVVGDLASADYVSFMVPGMFFTLQGQMVDWTTAAARVYAEESDWIGRITSGAPGVERESVAVVAWIGYTTPNLTTIGSLDLAYEGRDNLASAILGLQTVRTGAEPFVTILAHSYGSTAALMALTVYGVEVDALVVVGSPGSAAKSISELHVRNGNVFVGEAPWDPVPNSAFFGSDPGSKDYGAHLMSVAGGIDPITGLELAPTVGHVEYFGQGSESVRNMALVAIDRAGLVTTQKRE